MGKIVEGRWISGGHVLIGRPRVALRVGRAMVDNWSSYEQRRAATVK